MTKQKTQGAEAEPSWKRNSDKKFGKILISELDGIFTKAYLRRGSGGLTPPPPLRFFQGGVRFFGRSCDFFERGQRGKVEKNSMGLGSFHEGLRNYRGVEKYSRWL